MMGLRSTTLVSSLVLAGAAVLGGAPGLAQTVDAARIEGADTAGNDWLTYHGTYKSQHYSSLDQINPGNVKNLDVAWLHFPGRTTRGLQSMPLAANGVLYYSGSYSRVFALDGASGKPIGSYIPQ